MQISGELKYTIAVAFSDVLPPIYRNRPFLYHELLLTPSIPEVTARAGKFRPVAETGLEICKASKTTTEIKSWLSRW